MHTKEPRTMEGGGREGQKLTKLTPYATIIYSQLIILVVS